MIDLHSHILPAIDDGVKTFEEARALAFRAADDGVTSMVATPHVCEEFPTSPAQMEAGVASLRADFAEHAVNVDVLHGGELDLEFLPSLSEDDLRRFTLAQTGRYLLIEFPYSGWPLGLPSIVFDLHLKGFSVILAHPERNPEVHQAPGRLEAIVQIGAIVQINAGSVLGRFGRKTQRTAEALLSRGLVHAMASDAHHPILRRSELLGAGRALRNERLAHYLTVESPGAIIAGLPASAPRQYPRLRRFHWLM